MLIENFNKERYNLPPQLVCCSEFFHACCYQIEKENEKKNYIDQKWPLIGQR